MLNPQLVLKQRERLKMFFLKKKESELPLSIPGNLLHRLLTENKDWVVTNPTGQKIDILFLKEQKISVYNYSLTQIAISINLQQHVLDVFNLNDYKILSPIIATMIKDIKMNKKEYIRHLKSAVDSMCPSSSSQES